MHRLDKIYHRKTLFSTKLPVFRIYKLVFDIKGMLNWNFISSFIFLLTIGISVSVRLTDGRFN